MKPIPAPASLDPAARACFVRVEARLLARGEWRPEYVPLLAATAASCAAYLALTRGVRANGADPGDARKFEAALREKTIGRGIAREWFESFVAQPPPRVPFAPLDADPLDAAIEALCAPLEGDDRQAVQ